MRFKLLLLGLGVMAAILVAEYISRKTALSYGFLDALLTVPVYEEFGNSYKLKPNYALVIDTPIYSFLHKTNSHGLRQDTGPQDKNSKLLRVAFLGDSITYGIGVENNETFPSLLNEPSIEVLNFGVIGYGPLEEKELFENFVANFTPDVTVLVFYTGNDLDDIADGGGRFQIVDAYLRNKAAERKVSYRLKFIRTLPLIKNIHYTLIKRSNLYNIIIYGLRYTAEPVDYNNAFEKTTGIIGQMKKIADAEGKRLVLVVIPAAQEILGSPLELSQFLGGFAVHNRLREFAQENDIHFLDLVDDFRNYPKPDRLYIKDYNHLSKEGHQLVAEKLKNFLKDFHINAQ